MGRPSRYSPEVRERAVRMVFEHQREYDSQWRAMASTAPKIGCRAETLRKWVRQDERDAEQHGILVECRAQLRLARMGHQSGNRLVFGYEKRIAASSESWSRWIGGISRC